VIDLAVPFILFCAGAGAALGAGSFRVAQAASPDPDTPRPIDAFDSVWIEELTWMEVRDALRDGMTTAIIPTEGVEQNGPCLATAKHSIILEATAEAIARKLGDVLVAPIVSFAPEGEFDPPGGHLRYPGTLSVREETLSVPSTATTPAGRRGWRSEARRA